ncbi:YjgB family protein [Bacillus anthracis]|uniref:YjgB family protein n=1 Tax=Bacillus anthracis TaxID=1392 RepID=UPI0022701B4B|nr:YjgB family protein [Bacillus anthracis]MCX9098230.1 YjgB family protein [Bacillus anthracis]
MKVYVKIALLCLTFTCIFALAACKGTDEKKEANSTSENSKNEQNTSAEGKKEPEVKSNTDSNSKDTVINQKSINHVKNLFELAKEGKVPNVPFAAHTGDIEEIEKAWGKADKIEQAGNGMYATFTNKNVSFGFNKGSQVFDVRSYHAELKSITLQEIEKALGKPNSVKGNGEDKIYVYKVNNQFELKFIIPKSTGKVNHISVFSPEDSINKMAG